MTDLNKNDLPKIVDRQSKHLQLYPDTYFFCRCGLSKNGVYCDESHVGTDFGPKKCRISEPSTMAFCMCRHSKNFPYCDGSHRQLPTG
ncbi:CDGSH iron-sulfur domain-containing protein [bacterium]|nr:CDGSH iron-sulfur domain-containing protein [bacterium]